MEAQCRGPAREEGEERVPKEGLNGGHIHPTSASGRFCGTGGRQSQSGSLVLMLTRPVECGPQKRQRARWKGRKKREMEGGRVGERAIRRLYGDVWEAGLKGVM